MTGSCVLLVGSALAGVPPSRDPLAISTIVQDLRSFTTLAVAVVFVGVTLLVLAWWRLGALVHRPGGPGTRALTVTLAWWSAPLLFAMPLFSRDLYSYIAQGAMTVHGLDSYTFGPAILGAPLSLDVPAIWLYTPAPYGPVFLTLAADIFAITGDSARVGIVGMRLLALAGLALIVWAVPRLARAYGVNPSSALWLGVLNPLVVLHLAGDSHNDAIMLGMLCAGLALAAERRPAKGVALITLAALVKAPAALGLIFLVPVWARQMRDNDESRRGTGVSWLLAGLAVTGIAATVAILATTVAGTGYGWVTALDTPAKAHTWTSITTDLGYWTGRLLQPFDIATMEQSLWIWRFIGLALAGVICLVLLWRYERYDPVTAVGLGMGAVVALGPVMHPWYLLWGIVPLAAGATSPRIRRAVLYVTVAFAFCVLPGGVEPSIPAFAGAAIGAAAVLGISMLGHPPAWRRGFAAAPGRVRTVTEGPAVVAPCTAAPADGDVGRPAFGGARASRIAYD